MTDSAPIPGPGDKAAPSPAIKSSAAPIPPRDAASPEPPVAAAEKLKSEHRGLGELASTAICGNDITSSCLYVSALAIFWGGKWAPLCLLIVAVVLYLFRSIYGEVVSALPLNGGAYNALLNTTSKFRASMAACLTILSYMATAVISGNEAMHYLHSMWGGLPVVPATIVLLGIFLALTIFGITESAIVAIVIFLAHIATLLLLVVVGVIYVTTHGLSTLVANIALPAGDNVWVALVFGFSAAMLGISGFETSSNFVEEQKEGVFPKTLRNMWLAVSFFNPVLALLALATLPIPLMRSTEYQSALLTHVGGMAGGKWLSIFVGVDAVFVLSGAVLTSYVGVNGLVHRMTLDRCLPQPLLKTSRFGTTHRILILFFLLCISVLLITKGNVPALAGVYTISFLSVMALFGLGNLLLKIKRAGLPRSERAPWLFTLLGIMAVLVGLAGNVAMAPGNLKIFLQYFIPTAAIIVIMLERIMIMEGILFIVNSLISSAHLPLERLRTLIERLKEQILSQQVVFFARGHNVAHLNRVMQYVIDNEHTNRLKVVTVVNNPNEVSESLVHDIHVLDRAYPELEVQFMVVEGKFSPELIQRLSKEWRIPVNYMFIGSPEGRLKYPLADLGGVRLII
jgi:amino acid transporter